MKRIVISVLLCGVMLFVCGCKKNEPVEEPKVIKPETEKDSISYVIGTSMAHSLGDIKDDINPEMLILGIKDKLDGKPMLVSEERAQTLMREFSMKIQTREAEKDQAVADKNIEEGKKFLEENKNKEGTVTTESGLQYSVLKQGDGPKPAETDTVSVHYQGTTINGIEFDSSYKRGEPAVFPVNGVIKGWTEALLLMNAGSKYKLVIPSELAYGPSRVSPLIGPNEVLVFEVELLDIKKQDLE